MVGKPGKPRWSTCVIGGVPPFTEDVEFEWDGEVNLLIGPNATGKSTVLKILSPDFPTKGIPGYSGGNVSRRSIGWPEVRLGIPVSGAVPQITIPAVRDVPTPSPHDDSRVWYTEPPNHWNEWDQLLSAFPHSRFQNERVYHAIQKLFREDFTWVPRKTRGVSVVRKTLACVSDISGELVAGEPKDLQTEATLVGNQEKPYQATEVHHGMAVNTIETESEIYIGELSTGTQGLFWWIGFLALKMAHHANYAEGWAEKPGILLVDEIENHLHPTWQRRVIPALRKHFPGVQIFVTTHSPFVVAGLKRGQVHRLYREGRVIKTDKLTEEEKEQRIIGWTVEDILREFMDVDDPTDEPTAEAAATLRWLRERYPSDGSAKDWVAEKVAELEGSQERTRDEDAALRWLKNLRPSALNTGTIEWRESAMEELREQVSVDLEAGGPFAAQRELLLEQVRELLVDYEADASDPDEEG